MKAKITFLSIALILITTGTFLVKAQQTDQNILLNPYGDGKVGIGTTTPAEKLDVTGNIKATGTICDTNGCIGSSSSGGGSSYSLDSEDGDPTDVVYVNSEGKVGIGTQNAMKDLEVNGTLQTDEIKLDQKVSCGKLYTDVSGNVLCGDDQTGGVGVWSENLDDIYYNLGNVGIGTTPSSDIKLEINGKVKASEMNVTGTVTVENTLDMTGQRILNLAEPIEDTNAVNKAYVDEISSNNPSQISIQSTNEISRVEAIKYCRDLIEDEYDDWYLPTLEEAMLFIDDTVIDEGTDDEKLWTRTLESIENNFYSIFYAYKITGGVYLAGGYISNDDIFVRCVR